MSIQFRFLADCEDALPKVARWYFDEWGQHVKGVSIERVQERLANSLNKEVMPLVMLAVHGNDVVGAGELKYKEMGNLFPEKEHWLGGMYVVPQHRGNGYGSMLAEHIATIAPRYGVETLHLQTEARDGGLYANLGWVPVTRVENHGVDVLVMERYVGGAGYRRARRAETED